jgi:hypothetical protein
VQVQFACQLIHIAQHDHPRRTHLRTATTPEAEVGIHGDLAAEAGSWIVRREWIPQRDTARFEADQRFPELAEQHGSPYIPITANASAATPVNPTRS